MKEPRLQVLRRRLRAFRARLHRPTRESLGQTMGSLAGWFFFAGFVLGLLTFSRWLRETLGQADYDLFLFGGLIAALYMGMRLLRIVRVVHTTTLEDSLLIMRAMNDGFRTQHEFDINTLERITILEADLRDLDSRTPKPPTRRVIN